MHILGLWELKMLCFFNRRSLFNMYCCPCVVCGLSVCHYKKCNRNMIDEVVIEVDELDEGNISAEPGKQDE